MSETEEDGQDARAELGGVTAPALPAVGRTGWKASVTLAANLLVTVVLGSEHLQRWLNDATTETVRQMCVVRQNQSQTCLE